MRKYEKRQIYGVDAWRHIIRFWKPSRAVADIFSRAVKINCEIHPKLTSLQSGSWVTHMPFPCLPAYSELIGIVPSPYVQNLRFGYTSHQRVTS